jgi:hypothetical protein
MMGMKNQTGDLDADSRRLLNSMKTPEGLQTVMMHGLPAAAGVSVSGNVGMSTPLVGGMMSGKSPVESLSGASGALVSRFYDGMSQLSRGEMWKGLENLSPEFIASISRSTRMYQEGQKTSSGMPIYFKGQPVKETGVEAGMSAIGFKPTDWAVKSEQRSSERLIKQRWEDKRKLALESGEPSNFTSFNKALINAGVLGLVKPIKKAATGKPNKAATGYELAEENKQLGV